MLCLCVARASINVARASISLDTTSLPFTLAPFRLPSFCAVADRFWPAWLRDGVRRSRARPGPLLDAHLHSGAHSV